MSNLNKKRLYQAKEKESFMQTVKNDSSYAWIFDKSFDFENKFGKDLYQFNKEEILEFLASRNMSFESLKVNLSCIRSYINWSYEKGIKASNKNAADDITDTELKKISKKKRNVLHVDDIYEIVGRINGSNFPKLKNMQDRLLVYLLFLGVRGERASELINLKYKHIDLENGLIKLSELDANRKDLKVDKFCLDLIKSVKKESEYHRYMDGSNDKTTNIKEFYDLHDSEYVFRKSNVGKKSKSDKMSYAGILRRLQTISKYTDLKLTMNTVESSGMTYIAKKAIDAGYELKIDNPVIIKSIFERFNINNTSNSRHTLLSKLRKDVREVYSENNS